MAWQLKPRAQGWGASAQPIAARGVRGAGWGKGRLPALI